MCFNMWLVVHALVLINIDSNMHGDEIKIHDNNYLWLALVQRSASCVVEQWGPRYLATMSGVNCDVSDETSEYCKEFLEKYP